MSWKQRERRRVKSDGNAGKTLVMICLEEFSVVCMVLMCACLRMSRFRWACLGLALVMIIAYWRVWENGFVDFDDSVYVYENARVQAGLNWDAFKWAWFSTDTSNWHPVTWLSHLLDCQLYGLRPAGHHLTSLLFHIANAWLLFAVLVRMTGAVWRSALVVAFFAVHPLRVESVAWIGRILTVPPICYHGGLC